MCGREEIYTRCDRKCEWRRPSGTSRNRRKDNLTRQAMYVQCNTEVRSCNHCCSGKVMTITYSECVFVAFGVQQAKSISRILLPSVACPALPHFSTLSHWRNDFRKKKFIEQKMCDLIVYTTFHWSNSHSQKNSARYTWTLIFMQSTRHSCRVLMKFQFSRHVIEEYSNIKFHEVSSSRSRDVSCGRTDKHDEAKRRVSQFFERA
jgi:hypothetical protein